MKKQTRKVGVAGGFINQLMGNNASEPVVGEGATILSYSDRHAYEVIEVSQDGNACKIRKMDAKWVGTSYGDEQYELSSNESNHVIDLEWSERKSKWGAVGHKVDIIKSLEKKLYKQYGWGWTDYLPISIKDLRVYDEDGFCVGFKLVEGVTKRYKTFNPVSIFFGEASEYRDPHF